MGLPSYDEMYDPILRIMQDGELHQTKSIVENMIDCLKIPEEEYTKKLASGRRTVFANRVAWVLFNLKKAGTIDAIPNQGQYRITQEGKKLLEAGVHVTTAELSARYPAFAEMQKKKTIGKEEGTSAQEQSETPQETLDRVYNAINDQLADDLLTQIMSQSAAFFESLVVQLMRTMGYGDGFVTKYVGDGGIDGVIHEDKLGFNLIYIQAKRWNPETVIGKPEIQKFAGAMMGPPKVEKGLFITTARFSQGARDFADVQHIILVDGVKLSELMIEYGLGVSIEKTYHVKRIDTDFFSDSI